MIYQFTSCVPHSLIPLLWRMNHSQGEGGRSGDKAGTSQIGNISFQHVLSEHFISEKRHRVMTSLVQRPIAVQWWNYGALLGKRTRLQLQRWGGGVGQNSFCSTFSPFKIIIKFGKWAWVSFKDMQSKEPHITCPPLKKKKDWWAYHPASIFIWAQVGLDPDGAPGHPPLSLSFFLFFSLSFELDSLSSNPSNASHTSCLGD